MRTTLQLDDDILDAARFLARSERKSLGRVISDLVRDGLRAPAQEMVEDDFPVFQVSAAAPPITPEMVRRAGEDD